jgi:hypothetical protein
VNNSNKVTPPMKAVHRNTVSILLNLVAKALNCVAVVDFMLQWANCLYSTNG